MLNSPTMQPSILLRFAELQRINEALWPGKNGSFACANAKDTARWFRRGPSQNPSNLSMSQFGWFWATVKLWKGTLCLCIPHQQRVLEAKDCHVATALVLPLANTAQGGSRSRAWWNICKHASILESSYARCRRSGFQPNLFMVAKGRCKDWCQTDTNHESVFQAVPAPQKALSAWGATVTGSSTASTAWKLRQALLEVGKHCPVKCQLRSMMKLIKGPCLVTCWYIVLQLQWKKTCAVEGLSCAYLQSLQTSKPKHCIMYYLLFTAQWTRACTDPHIASIEWESLALKKQSGHSGHFSQHQKDWPCNRSMLVAEAGFGSQPCEIVGTSENAKKHWTRIYTIWAAQHLHWKLRSVDYNRNAWAVIF